jgi:quinol monooxygenase YgiN
MKFLALMTGVLLMTTTPALTQSTPNNQYPPLIPAPEDAMPVVVIVELTAKNPQVLEQYLKSAGVIPTTRLASGINYIWTVRDQNKPGQFVLIQQWNSVKQQQHYLQWRIDRGDVAKLRSLLTEDPVVKYLTPIDMTTLPAQIR